MLRVTKYGEPYPTGLRVSNTIVTPGVLFVSQTGRNMCNVLQIIKFPIKVFCCNRVTRYHLLHSSFFRPVLLRECVTLPWSQNKKGLG